MNKFFAFVLILIVNVIRVNSLASCPPPYLDISPCDCLEDRTGVIPSAIRCMGEEALDLVTVFEILDANIGPDSKDFNIFYLNNTSIEEIPENVFKYFTFEEIFFENTLNLTKLSQKSFNGLEQSVKHLHIRDTNLNLNSGNYSDVQAFDGLINLEFLDFSSSECPPNSLLGPKCKCDLVLDLEIQNIVRPESTVILCEKVVDTEELVQLFDGLSVGLSDNKKNYFRFHLKDSQINELPEDLFNGIAFSEVVIEDCPQLKQIHRNVFKSVEPFVNRLSISNIDLTNDTKTSEDIWYAISSLSNLVSIDLVNVFDEIPDKAFKTVGTGIQLRLKYFTHSGYDTFHSNGHRIKSIGRYAFNTLPNIQIINIQNNLIETIDKYSFANQISSERQLLIRLARNKLSHTSFSVGALAGSQRPIKLELGKPFVGCNRDIQFLDESVFSAFLDKSGNELDIGCAFAMVCDCRMKWLYDGPDFWKLKIRTGIAGDIVIPCMVETNDIEEDVSIWDLPEDYFDCSSQTDIKTDGLESPLNQTLENEVQELIDDEINLID